MEYSQALEHCQVVVCLVRAAGLISDKKKIVKQFRLLNLFEEGSAVMSDKGFLTSDILSFEKVLPISPAHCRGPRLLGKGTAYTYDFTSLRYMLKQIF